MRSEKRELSGERRRHSSEGILERIQKPNGQLRLNYENEAVEMITAVRTSLRTSGKKPELNSNVKPRLEEIGVPERQKLRVW